MNANQFLIAFLAGCASAAMTASVAAFSAVAVVLFYLAPLPLLIIGFANGALSAAVAGVAGSLVIGFVMGLKPGLFFLFSTAIAPVVLSHFALLRRPATQGPIAEGEVRAQGHEWYPEGRLLLWCAGLAGVLVAASILAAGPDAETFRNLIRSTVNIMMEPQLQTMSAPEREQAGQVIDLMVVALPMISAALWLVTLYVNMRLAGAIATASGKGLRPWAGFGDMRFPRMAGMAFAATTALAMLPGTFGVLASVFAAAFGTALTLLGLSVIHGVMASHKAKAALLFALYFALSVLNWILVLPLAALGLVDLFTDIRARKGAQAANSNNPPSKE
jgi:hypothetical protein